MRSLLVLLLFLPLVGAVAVTPTSLDFTIDAEEEIRITNTADGPMYFRLLGVYEDTFLLSGNESKTIVVTRENNEEYLRIEEVYGVNMVNAVELPVFYSPEPYTVEKLWYTEPQRVSLLILFGGLFLGLGLFAGRKCVPAVRRWQLRRGKTIHC